MRILIVTPAVPGSRKGNRVTACRWRKLLQGSGHRVTIATTYTGQSCDVCVALHAKKSAASIQRFAESCPDQPLLVVLTGTDLYRDITTSHAAQRSLELADRLIVLQPEAKRAVPIAFQSKTCVIFQAVPKRRPLPTKLTSHFEVTVMGHLRPVKDPFRAALAARRLPADSKIRIVHCGQALTDSIRQRAEREMARNPRYQWQGELPRWQALQRLARSRVMVLSSILEGGANVVSEALACQVPILSSRIAGSIGLLGNDYPGFFECRDTARLTELLRRTEVDAAFYKSLKMACKNREWLIAPALERDTWKALLESFER